jgi:HrpA-like RNA helicase
LKIHELEPQGDILMFLTGQGEIEQAIHNVLDSNGIIIFNKGLLETQKEI